MHFMASKYSGTGIVKRRLGNCGRLPEVVFVPRRNKTFDAIVKANQGQVMLIGDAMGNFADDLRGLKKWRPRPCRNPRANASTLPCRK